MSDDSDGLSDAVGDRAIEPQHSGRARFGKCGARAGQPLSGGGRVVEGAAVCAAEVLPGRPHPARVRPRSSPTLRGAFAALLACCHGRMHAALCCGQQAERDDATNFGVCVPQQALGDDDELADSEGSEDEMSCSEDGGGGGRGAKRAIGKRRRTRRRR